MKGQDLEKLKRLISAFEGRPNHLAKFLSEKNAFNDEFIDKLSKSEVNIDDMPNFRTIKEMKRWFNDLIDDLDHLKKKKTKKQIIKELNKKLQTAIEMEDFEEACRIRDYMIKNNYRSKPNK